MAFDLPAGVESAAKSLSLAAHDKGLDLRWRVAPDVPASLTGDPNRVRQILVNLMNVAMNAVLLYLTGRALGKSHVAKEGQQMFQTPSKFGCPSGVRDGVHFPVEVSLSRGVHSKTM